jgi:hypothetical protein
MDERENSESAFRLASTFMEAGVFGSPRPWADSVRPPGPLGMAVAGASRPWLQARRAVRSYVRLGALDTVAAPALGVAMAGRDVHDPYKD